MAVGRAGQCVSCGCLHPRGQHPIPRDFNGPLGDALLAWSAGHGLTPHQTRYAAQAVRDWADAGGHRRACWVAVVRNAMRRGWALKGYTLPPGSERRPQHLLVVGTPEWRRAQGEG